MIINLIEGWLEQTFQLPAMPSVTQTKVEQAIYYSFDNVRIYNKANYRQEVEVDLYITLRAVAGKENISFLTYKLGIREPSDFVRVLSSSAMEYVELVSETEMMIGKSVVVQIIIERDKVQEKIKFIKQKEV